MKVDFGITQAAPVLGDAWIVMHNINSLSTLGAVAIHPDGLAHVWPEANVPTRARKVMKTIMRKGAVELTFSQPANVRTASGMNAANDSYNVDQQCRLAIGVRRPTKAVQLAIEGADDKMLLNSGRWHEVLLPIGNGDQHIIVAGFYGVSGASSDAPKKRANERLLSAAIKRAVQFKHTPYLIAGDLNVDPEQSDALCAAVDAGELVDVFASRASDRDNLQATYCKEGVFCEMKGSGKTRIDAIFANSLANALVDQVQYRWDVGQRFDHVCLAVKLQCSAMTQKVRRLQPVVPIGLDNFYYDPPEKA